MTSPQHNLLLYVGFLVLSSSFTCTVGAVNNDDEPPINPFLAVSPWPMIHRNPYQQGSSNLPGPVTADGLQKDIVPLVNAVAPLYDNTNNLWMHQPYAGYTTYVHRQGTTSLQPKGNYWEGITLEGLSGAYTLVDRDNVFYNGRGSTIQAFAYQGGGVVQKIREYEIPSGGILVGLNLLYDGRLVYTTASATVGVIPRSFDSATAPLQLGTDETISNSMAVDEKGGIYVVTSQHMYRVQWDGTALSVAWRAKYDTGGTTQNNGGRLGVGSGSTPSLMGTGNDTDKFVVITDGNPLMNIVLFWRDDIPDDWVPVVADEPRIAGQVPVTFGDEAARTSVSEQSVLVRGYDAVVVNNDYGILIPSWFPSLLSQLVVFLSNLPFIAPYGIEKFAWDPVSRTLKMAWATRNISCPNGIPTMSSSSGLMYCVGQRFFAWTLEAVDWDSGESAFHKFLGWWIFSNSVYTAMEVGPDQELITGALGGAMRFRASR